jgi:hypothetical protein
LKAMHGLIKQNKYLMPGKGVGDQTSHLNCFMLWLQVS